MKRKIFLHGYLNDLHPEPIEVEATTVAEALRALEQIPALKPQHGLGHPVQIDGVQTDVHLFGTNESLTEIHLRPHLGGGGGRNPLAQILIGVALVSLALWMGPGVIAGTGGWLSGSTIFMTGAGLIAGGLLQLMMPSPDENTEEERSKYLPATTNTVRVGTPIPILVGARMVGGHLLSIDSDVKSVTSDGAGGVSGADSLPPGSTADEIAQYDARNGTGSYASGKWSYEAYRISPREGREGGGEGIPYNVGNREVFARGFVNDLDPYDLVDVLTMGRGARGILLDYFTTFTPATTGVYEFSDPTPYPATIDIGGQTPANRQFSLTQGVSVTIKLSLSFTFEPVDKATLILDLKPPAGAFAPLSTFIGADPPPPPANVEIVENLFLEYDKPVVPDGYTPIRPIFASPVASPSNIPTSEWRA